MRLLIINPDSGMSGEEMQDRCRRLKKYVSSDTELHMVCLTKSNIELDSRMEAALAAPEIISMAVEGQNQGFDGIVLYCFSDPALEACREAVDIPVIGGGQAACLTVPVLGYRAGLLLAGQSRRAEKEAFIRQSGLNADYVCACCGIDMTDLNPWRDREIVKNRLLEAGEKMIREQAVQVLVLGCLSFLGLGESLGPLLKIPVIDSAAAAVSMAESIVRQQISTSKRSYPRPKKGQRRWREGYIML